MSNPICTAQGRERREEPSDSHVSRLDVPPWRPIHRSLLRVPGPVGAGKCGLMGGWLTLVMDQLYVHDTGNKDSSWQCCGHSAVLGWGALVALWRWG